MSTQAPIRYYSTNQTVDPVPFQEALLQGQATDRGLYLPDRVPTISREELRAWKDLSYAEIAYKVLAKYVSEDFDEQHLTALCKDAYDYDVPLEHVTDRRYLMRLDQGPTASFKDFAARMMARWMGHFMANIDGELVILTATSGDTGSAVAHAYHGIDRVKVVVLFPIDEVSNRQRKQMTTIGDNVKTISMTGKFDDCQALVKRAFADPDLSKIRLTSANSINIGRLLPQSVYYIYAYLKLANIEADEHITFSVPSGNFGDMMGSIIAKKMGLPIDKIIIATNANDEVPVFMRTGEYHKIEPSRVCISNAMNVGHPSNLARLVDLYGGWMDETGLIKKMPNLDELRSDLYSVSITDDVTRDTIKDTYEQYETILEPHGAVGWAGLNQYLAHNPDAADNLTVSVETAHPAKFPEEIQKLINIDPSQPLSLIGIEDKPEACVAAPSIEYAWFKDFLLENYC